MGQKDLWWVVKSLDDIQSCVVAGKNTNSATICYGTCVEDER